MGQLPNGQWQTVKWVAGRCVLVLPSGVDALVEAGGSDTITESVLEATDANPRLLIVLKPIVKKVTTRAQSLMSGNGNHGSILTNKRMQCNRPESDTRIGSRLLEDLACSQTDPSDALAQRRNS